MQKNVIGKQIAVLSHHFLYEGGGNGRKIRIVGESATVLILVAGEVVAEFIHCTYTLNSQHTRN
jgi:hypothetical protein